MKRRKPLKLEFCYSDTPECRCVSLEPGAIGTSQNVVPRHFANMYYCCMRNDFAAAAKWQDATNKFVELLISNENWSIWKAMMKHVGIDCSAARKPYAPLAPAEERKWIERFAALKLVEGIG